jgi:cell division protein FtsN
LEDDNRGIILDVSERGLSLQAVGSLTDDQVPHIRFQLSESRPWIETRGRIAWISASKKTAGVEFIELIEEARNQINHWISLELQLDESVEGIAFGEKTEPEKDVPATFEPENAILLPERKTTEHGAENQKLNLIAEEAMGVPRSGQKVLHSSRVESTTSGFAESAPGTTAPPIAWSELEARLNREINAHKRTNFSQESGRLIGLIAGGVLLLSTAFFLGYHLQKRTYSHQEVEARPFAKVPEPSTNTSVGPTNSRVDLTLSSHGPGFMLQVGAMTHKENADALAGALQRKNFPVLVSPPGTDRLYRVVVGPYSDADSMLRAKEELKEEGFESIRTPRKPSTDQANHSVRLR